MVRKIVREQGKNIKVEVGLRDGENAADVEDDIERSFDFADDLLAKGTQLWESKYRWVGPIKWLAYKEVGPPPWRWPRIGIHTRGWNHPTVRFIIGWRSTAYALLIMWSGKHVAK